MIHFVHQGSTLTLTRQQVEDSLRHVHPAPLHDLAVWVHARWFPVKQAFVTPLGMTNRDTNSRVAYRHLKNLGFPVHDAKVDGPRPPAPGTTHGVPDAHRELALTLAVTLRQRTPGIARQDVVAVATTFLQWLDS